MRKIFFALVAVLVCGCEKMVIDDDVYSKGDNGGNVTLHVTSTDGATRSSVLSDVCGRLNVATSTLAGRRSRLLRRPLPTQALVLSAYPWRLGAILWWLSAIIVQVVLPSRAQTK